MNVRIRIDKLPNPYQYMGGHHFISFQPVLFPLPFIVYHCRIVAQLNRLN